jgi:glycine dehydrogenase subunit 2
MNLHKTFATPHGGGGPGAGPVAANARLLPFLPIPMVGMKKDKIQNDNMQNDQYVWLTEKECPQSIGRLSAFMGNAGINLRAYIYIRMLGKAGLHRVSEFATLNANYLMKELAKIGLTLAYPKRRASHEFTITLKPEAKLLDFKCHAPTTYFPLLIPECWLIEPTETECKESIDFFIQTVKIILQEAKDSPQFIKNAPYCMPVQRLDDIKAALKLDVKYD